MKIKLSLLFLLLALIFPGGGICDELNQARLLFYQGNTRYSEEKFEQAIADYEKVLSLGFESGPLYYNLGNAYFKRGLLGKAILNYLRAQRLMPADADLKSNLTYVQSLIDNKTPAPEQKWFIRTFSGLAQIFTLDRITLITTILYFVLSIVVIFAILKRDLRKKIVYLSILISTLLVVSLSLFFIQFYNTVLQKQAVVIISKVEAKFEPFDDATRFFTLYEGETVVVTTTRKDWVKVKRIDGKKGWIKKTDIELL